MLEKLFDKYPWLVWVFVSVLFIIAAYAESLF